MSIAAAWPYCLAFFATPLVINSRRNLPAPLREWVHDLKPPNVLVALYDGKPVTLGRFWQLNSQGFRIIAKEVLDVRNDPKSYTRRHHHGHRRQRLPDQRGGRRASRSVDCRSTKSAARTVAAFPSTTIRRIRVQQVQYGSPAPVFLTGGHERESALARLVDVFSIGVRGQAFRDFLEGGRRQGKSGAKVVGEWRECEQSALGNRD
jgi:hypothetical protein